MFKKQLNLKSIIYKISKFFFKQPFTSKLLLKALKLRHLYFCWYHDEFEFLSHARVVAFYSKTIMSLTFEIEVWLCGMI